MTVSAACLTLDLRQWSRDRDATPRPVHPSPHHEDCTLNNRLTPCSQEVDREPAEASAHAPGLAEALRVAALRSTIDRSVWSSPGRAGFHVRGAHYLQV